MGKTKVMLGYTANNRFSRTEGFLEYWYHLTHCLYIKDLFLTAALLANAMNLPSLDREVLRALALRQSLFLFISWFALPHGLL